MAKQAVAEASDIRADKVTQVKKQIASGTYKVDTGEKEYAPPKSRKRIRKNHKIHDFSASLLLPPFNHIGNLFSQFDKFQHILEMIGLTEQRNAYPGQLSVSAEQRIVIGRSFAMYPDLLLMDEPYGQMDIILTLTTI